MIADTVMLYIVYASVETSASYGCSSILWPSSSTHFTGSVLAVIDAEFDSDCVLPVFCLQFWRVQVLFSLLIDTDCAHCCCSVSK